MIRNNNLLLKITSVLFIAFVLVSCGGKKVTNMSEAEKAVIAEEKEIETTDATKKLVPDWYDNTDKDKDCKSGNYVCFVGAEINNDDIQIARTIAEEIAKASLASYVGGELSSIIDLVRDQAKIGKETTTSQTFTQIIQDINKKVSTKGWEQLACTADCSPDNTNLWNAFVLLKYDKYYAKQLLVAEVKKDQELESKARIAKAWQELEEEINEAEKSN